MAHRKRKGTIDIGAADEPSFAAVLQNFSDKPEENRALGKIDFSEQPACVHLGQNTGQACLPGMDDTSATRRRKPIHRRIHLMLAIIHRGQ